MGPLLPLRPFDKNQMQRIVERLQSLEPWGQTPLYMGILDAIDAFPRDAPAGPRRIVAMTDGFDEPGYAGALPGVPAPRRGVKFRKDVEDVLRQPGNEGIQLDILGFNIEVANAADQQSLKDLTELAEHTGGGFFPVNDPTSLLKALEKSLQLGSYVVQRTSDGGEVTPAPLELNRTFIFPPVERKTAYIVKLKDQAEPAQAEVAIEGGEALELFVRDDPRRHARRLVGRRYDRDLRVSSDGVINPADPQNHYFLGAHLPEWQGRAVRFPVSIQNADEEQFSPRPAEAWVQIRPLGSKAGQAGAYVFYDPQYENERPVPVLSCLALGWPEDARAAEVLLWCKMTKTAPDRTIPIGRFGQQKLATGAGQEAAFELEVKRGANADAALTVTIIERHGAGSGLDTVKVEIDPSPRKVVHRYNAPAGTIRHSFYYDDAAAGQIDDYRVLLTTRKRLAEQAIALPEPLVITIPRVAVAAER
jgi:hypothetical protein